MKTFLLAFNVTKGAPLRRIGETFYGSKIVNALSLNEAKDKMEAYIRKRYVSRDFIWSISGKEISQKRLENLLKGRSRRIF